MSTFIFPSVKIGKLDKDVAYQATVSTVMKSVDVYNYKKHEILQTSKQSSKNVKEIRCGNNNGLISSHLTAYNRHIPLVVKPDDIWIACMVAFGKYVDAHPKQMQKYFVSDEERAELEQKEAEENEQKRILQEKKDVIRKKIDDRYAELNGEEHSSRIKEEHPSRIKLVRRRNIVDSRIREFYDELSALEPPMVSVTRYDANGIPIIVHESKTKPTTESKIEKKKLDVNVMDYELPTKHSSTSDIYKFVSKFTDEIQKNSNESIVNWILPDFSTTTEVDKMVGKLVLMGTVKKFFEYGCGAVSCCGISKVTLEGTLEDWIELRQKVNRFYEFDAPDLVNWGKVLSHVLDNYILLYKGIPDLDFWQQMYTSVTGGSGMKYKNVSGWILAFAPFSDKGNNILSSYNRIMETREYGCISAYDICDCGIDATINVTVTSAETKEVVGKFNYLFYSGLLMAKYDTKKNEIRASVDWCMIKEKTED